VKALPIDEIRGAFLEALDGERPVVVSAPAGSGKSTRLPGWLVDAGRTRVLVVEPRRVAARALAGWVAKERGGKLGGEVGYQVRFEGRHGADTKVLFVTPGVALSMLSDRKTAERFDAVVVDEFHERAWEVDLVVALVRSMRASTGHPQLVLCSATLAERELADALQAEVVHGEGRTFPVALEHQGDGPPTDRDLDVRVASTVEATLREREGDVLVFLPGKGEIERCGRALSGCAAEVVAVHGGLPPGRLAEALGSAAGRRVFLSTNVAETSLTIPGVRTVVDCGLARMRVHQAGHSVLALVPISEASATQRAGRAGRVAPGVCIRLWSAHYVAEEHTPPELLRVELDDVLLRAAAAGLHGEGFVHAPWVTPPPAFAMRAARDRLLASGDLDDEGALTERGRGRAKLPVSVFCARIATEPPKAIAGAIADLVALIELSRPLVLTGRISARADDARAELFAGALDDVEVGLRALAHGDASAHGLHPGGLREARGIARQLRERLGIPRRRDDDPPIPQIRSQLVEHLLRRVPEAAFVPRSKRRGRRSRDDARTATPWGNGEVEIGLRPVVIPGIAEEEQPAPMPAALVLDLEWIGVGRRARGFGRLAMRCGPADLLAAGLGDANAGPPILTTQDGRKRGRRVVVADVEVTYAGTILERERVPLSGGPLLRGLATLILAGRFKRLDADAIRGTHHVERLLHQLAAKGGAAIDLDDLIAARLTDMLAPMRADLELVETTDLCPDLGAIALAHGIDAREPEALARDFPREWAHGGTTFACNVDLKRRKVVLEPIRSVGKGREPAANVLPRFRGFAVEYRKASRQIRLR